MHEFPSVITKGDLVCFLFFYFFLSFSCVIQVLVGTNRTTENHRKHLNTHLQESGGVIRRRNTGQYKDWLMHVQPIRAETQNVIGPEGDWVCMCVVLTFHRQPHGERPWPLLRPLLHHAGQLPAVIRRRGNQPVIAAHGHRAVRPVHGAGWVVASDLRQPLDGGCRFAVRRLALGHHHRLGAGLDRHYVGRVLRLGWRERERGRETAALNVRRRQER